MSKFPDFITHYSRSEPFRSMTSIPFEKRHEVIQKLTEKTTWGLNRFLHPTYLDQRLEVEKQLRQEFILRGGKPELQFPYYFFLGRNSKFEENKNNKAYIIHLDDLPQGSITFTYGDSLLAHNRENRSLSGEMYQNSLCIKIFGRDNLKDLFSDADFPKKKSLHVEAQLWIQPSKEIVKSLEY